MKPARNTIIAFALGLAATRCGGGDDDDDDASTAVYSCCDCSLEGPGCSMEMDPLQGEWTEADCRDFCSGGFTCPVKDVFVSDDC